MGFKSSIPNSILSPKALRTELSFEKSLNLVKNISLNICPRCGGSGDLRAMQSMAVIGGDSVRGPDTKVECDLCNGSGQVT